MTNPIQFLKEAKNELFKVVWPKRPEILRITLAVIIISLVIAVFLGGGAVSLISIYLTKNSKFKTWQYLIFVLGFTIIVGIGWEYFEFAVDQIFEDKFGWNRMTLRDTLGDLLYDGLGATIFWVVYKDRI